MQQGEQKTRKPRVIVGVTGSVATIRVVELIKELIQHCEVKLVMTESSKKFIRKEELQQIKVLSQVECLEDLDQATRWNKRGDPVLHIELRKWADALVIAPLSANSLAKIASGICDNLLTLICRCWDMRTKPAENKQNKHKRQLQRPIIVAPAMNTMMWDHPITAQQLNRLQQWGYTIIDPIQKTLVCGDQGKGAMAHLPTIAAALYNQLSLSIN